jgi:tetratricopeptide (TPR) repeat protein
MADHEVLFTEAERLRVHGNEPADFRRAIALYREYVEAGGPNERAADHMTGVCHRLLGDCDGALEWFLGAMDGATGFERGNIERDAAECHGALGEFAMAEARLNSSLALLPYDTYPEEHAATRGFWGRLQLRRGRIDEALEMLADADQRLRAGSNRYMELYNKLAFARALRLAGRKSEARKVALDCLRLATRTDPATGLRYGNHQHNLRALAILDEHGTEEGLAAELGLTETAEMAALRQELLRCATTIDADSPGFLQPMEHYRRLGEAIAEAKSDAGKARERATLALELLVTSVLRDLSTLNGAFSDLLRECTSDAEWHASNLGEIEMGRTIAALPRPNLF